MTVAAKLARYLEERGVPCEVRTHPLTPSASRTAEASHISGHAIAKGVVLKDGGGYLLAVLPASHEINFEDLERLLGRKVELASEEEAASLFPDCDIGAVPALGAPYGLDVVVDEHLIGQPEVYIEGGDHASLVHVTGEQFRMLESDARRGRFSTPHWTQAVNPKK